VVVAVVDLLAAVAAVAVWYITTLLQFLVCHKRTRSRLALEVMDSRHIIAAPLVRLAVVRRLVVLLRMAVVVVGQGYVLVVAMAFPDWPVEVVVAVALQILAR